MSDSRALPPLENGSHFESDECGVLNDRLQLAPHTQPVCTLVGKLVSVDDFSIRPARGMTRDDVLSTGKYRYRSYRLPHIPHGWEAGVLSEETRETLSVPTSFITSAILNRSLRLT